MKGGSDIDYDDLPEGYFDEPACDHTDDYEISWEGRWECGSCDYSRWATTAEIEAYDRWQREYAEHCEREERRERSPLWRMWRWIKAHMPRLPRWRREPKPFLDLDDEIPF